MQLREIMTTTLQSASPSATPAEVARMMSTANVGCILMCEEDRLVGIITDRDIATRCVGKGHNPTECKAGDHMSTNVRTAGPEMTAEEALKIMAQKQIRRLPVVDNGRLVGVVSLGDLAVETRGEPEVASSLTEISRPIHPTEGGHPKVAVAA